MNIKSIVTSAAEVFKKKMLKHCETMELEKKELTPYIAEEFTTGLKKSICASCLGALKEFVESYDKKSKEPVERKEIKYHWKMVSEKKFLTPFGQMNVSRNIYQANEEGECYVPVDEKWGMKGEFATVEVREMILYTLAHLTPKETKKHLKKCGWINVSETAIKNIGKEMGHFVEFQKKEINNLIREEEKIPDQTRVLVASIDGVNVLLNKPGTKKGRPIERPKEQENNQQSLSTYKNAMVGSISFYGKVPEEKKSPARLSSLYTSRMPEEKFPKLKQQFENELEHIESSLEANVTKIVLCDGARSIWNYVGSSVLFHDYKKLLDFYHMTEHLSRASEAIFGKKSHHAKCWYKRWRKKMLEVDQAPQNLLQSLNYYFDSSNLSASRQKNLETEITFFRRNKHLMTYADFLRKGLPIGSGPVEAACKTIVKHRLCRSGMRWSIRGGQAVLHLRCYVKSNRWDFFWNSYKVLKFAS